MRLPWQLVVTWLVYAAITVCGFVIAIPLGITKADFGGYCVLFTDIKWVNENHFIAEFGDGTACDFASYLPVCACVVQGLFMAVYHGYAVIRACQSKDYVVRMIWVMPWLLINTMVMVLMFITSCVITTGFSHTCSQLMDNSNPKYRTCADFQKNMEWTNPLGRKIDTSTFYRNLSVAQVASWMGSVLWLVVVLLLIVRLLRARWNRAGNVTMSASSSQERTIIADISPTA